MIPGVERLWAALPEARIAGGAVRDHLLGVPVSDVDFASPLTPEAVMERLTASGIKTIPTGLAHGTVTAVIGKRGFEITTLRRDVETDGRRAVVAFTDDWRQDAARRDFTINAMSMARDGAVFDYFGGQADLNAGIVRFVGEAEIRIAEDYLRILRFFRFFARYAKGAPDRQAIAAITKLRAGISQLSAERVWSELKRILAAADPRAAIALMETTGVMPLVFPEGANVPALNRLVEHGAPAEPILRVASLFQGNVETFAARLRLSGGELDWLLSVRKPNPLAPASKDDDLRRALADEEPRILIAKSWLTQHAEPGWDELRSRIAALPVPVFPLQGRDIKTLGIPAGPRIGKLLEAVRTWWLANGCIADFDSCLEKARSLSTTST
jgi:poly(A) polymerase